MNNKPDSQKPLTILGLDPGTRKAGFSVLIAKKSNPLQPQDFKILQLGVLNANPSYGLNQRIGGLHSCLLELIQEFTPHVCVMEKAFLGPNVQSALKLGQIRGAFMSALFQNTIQLEEIAPTSVKKLIAGKGNASKTEVQMCVKRLMNLPQATKLPEDASDALAIALTYGLSLSMRMAF